jgi:hypothetical protein
MTELELKQMAEMREHLGKLHQAWRDRIERGEDDGHCKSNEGYIGVLYRYPNWFECTSQEDYTTAKPTLSLVEVYSYLFGPSRLHSFDTVAEAHKEVMSW